MNFWHKFLAFNQFSFDKNLSIKVYLFDMSTYRTNGY